MSNLNRPQNELTGKKGGSVDRALKAQWAGSAWGGDIIAPVSKGRQYTGIDEGRATQGAPRRPGAVDPKVTKMDPSGSPANYYCGAAGGGTAKVSAKRYGKATVRTHR